uniref:Uncharacterized protein n=1 Tax=Hyaloperonospora arabidopsidis (strain Emoy2) TaxID=559515 RepID=M4BEP2_HYAAE
MGPRRGHELGTSRICKMNGGEVVTNVPVKRRQLPGFDRGPSSVNLVPHR